MILEGVLMFEKIKTLKQIKIDGENWLIYYVDEINGDKWVKEYPESEYHGGGPAQLKLVEKFPWEGSK
ncbi:MAG: hypothetical protein H7Y01_06710 [Ferruginibacter sp.]|nr:hypothetical protein [Chitinophagaceae bacterium]